MDHGRIAIQEFEGLLPKVNRRTLQRDLKAMQEKGLIQEAGTSPTDPTKSYELSDMIRKNAMTSYDEEL
jgi:DNA-binding HxlR family transcriptional regulator